MFKMFNTHLLNIFGVHYKRVFYGTLFLWYGGMTFIKILYSFLPYTLAHQVDHDMVGVLLLWCGYLFLLAVKDRDFIWKMK